MIDSIKKNIIDNKFNLIIFFLYVIICVIAMLHHEMWRDETRVWYFVNSFDLKSLIDSIRFDGHPFLWYVFILFFNKIGLPPLPMNKV